MTATGDDPGVSNLMGFGNGDAPWIGGEGAQPVELMVEASRMSAGMVADGVAARAPADIELANRWDQLQRLSNADALNAAEVLELLLHFCPSRHRAVSLAGQLYNRFGSLGAAIAADPVRLSEVLGADRCSVMLLKTVHAAVKAILREPLEDRPVIKSASALMDYLSMTMKHDSSEATRILYLDRKNALIKDEIQFRGTVDFTPLWPREIVKRVLELGACALILVHNHVSGDPKPSRADIQMTRQLATALATVQVALHDHIIIGRNKESSFRKLRLL